MRARRLAARLARCESRFAAPFFERHRSHVGGAPGCQLALLALAVLVLAGTLAPLALGWEDRARVGSGTLVRAAVAVGFIVLFATGAIAADRDQFRVRVLPYFERAVGEIDTWLAGTDLIWHSRALDEAAVRCGVTPLSAFSSGDDLIVGETLRWFDPAEALPTLDRLRQPEILADFPAGVASDLDRLAAALKRASDRGIRFSLLVREGSFASGHEMSQRRGTFF